MASSEGASAASVREPRDHAVQFYERRESFLDDASAFLAAGLSVGDPGLVIATEDNRRGLEDRLSRGGLDLKTARATGRYRPLDASETMAKFLVGSTVDEARFREVVGAALVGSGPRHEARPVRVFGEMVAVLCSRGMPEAALRVEQLWNELADRHSFSLLCAYPIDGFATPEQSDAFSKICLEHTRVIPVENYSDRAGADRRTRVIAELQRKAAALEREMVLRREAEESLRRRERELDDMNRRKDEFLAMLGHELRNPMSPIVTALHVVRLKPNDPAVLSRSLEMVERNFQRVMRLVDDLLDVSRITSGKIELREERVALSAIVERAVEQSRAALEERGHRLSLSLPEEPITLRADPTRLEQVLVNLLINAARYTDFGGRVALSVAREGEEAVLRVRDNGIGMSPEVCERVFELFAQGPHASGSRPAGLGVGLTLVRRLVELHGGTVVASSEGPAKGSELVVRLPIREAAPCFQGEDSKARPAPKPRRVLVVDDNEDVAEGLAEYFRAAGHEVRTARDGASAIAESARLRPEIAFLDIGMPDMDGHELARRLRAMESLRGIRLVALTGYGQESDRLRAQAAGFDHHLVKPVDIAKLDRLLDLEKDE